MRSTKVATFNVTDVDNVNPLVTRYDIVHVEFDQNDVDAMWDEYRVKEYDHTDWHDVGKLVRDTPHYTMAEAVAACLINCGWGEHTVEMNY